MFLRNVLGMCGAKSKQACLGCLNILVVALETRPSRRARDGPPERSACKSAVASFSSSWLALGVFPVISFSQDLVTLTKT